MLRKNAEKRLERLMPDGAWLELPEDEQPPEVRKTLATGTLTESRGGVDWTQLGDLFSDAQEVEVANAGSAGDAASGDTDRAAGGDVATAGGDGSVGNGQVVAPAKKTRRPRPSRAAHLREADPGPDGRGMDAAGSDRALAIPEPGPVSTGVEEALDIEVPGLVSGDGKTGTSGTSKVLQKLRARRGVAQGGVRPPAVRVEVSVGAARPRGPAVRDTTERRITRRAKERNGVISARIVDKPAPKSLAEAPKWMQELFESHFRSSRTLELRRTMNRMKLSRLDYAIGWMVAIEAARRDPSILHVRKDGSTAGA